MSEKFEEYIDILIKLEPAFRRAGDLALELRSTTLKCNKSETGVPAADMVTEADLAVQEAILTEFIKTKLIECQLIAEEDTQSVAKFKGTNGLVLTLDPIDGTIFYASDKRFFSIIVCLHDGKSLLYCFCFYPTVNWARRITRNKIKDFGVLPKVRTRVGLDLSRIIAVSKGEPNKVAPEIYDKLIKEGYNFLPYSEISDEAGTCILLYTNQAAGYFTNYPSAYDGLCALYYGQVLKYQIYSDIDISKSVDGAHGKYYPGWYLVLRK